MSLHYPSHDAFAPDPRGDDLPPYKQVYANRNLRMDSIAAIGFDMDHTLALYNHHVFEQLCFEMAIDLMVETKGYPELIREIDYDRSAVCRGLIIDKRLGNIIKMDANNYVSRVSHGGVLLSHDERRAAYKRSRIRQTAGRYRVVDTLFDLPEGSLYAALISLKDREPGVITNSYKVLFEDIRDAIDSIHRDGSLKRKIMADLPRYFVKDPALEETLVKFREAGKKLFLLTNSEPDYTGAVMTYILSNGGGSWTRFFDLIICSSRKPGFFLQKGKGRAVPPGSVRGLDNDKGQCYTGGDAFFLESKLGSIGDSILYFGDHTYGDILRSKKSVGWRTAMIVPEVEEEILSTRPVLESIRELEHIEDTIEDLTLERDHLLSVPTHDPEAVSVLRDYIRASLGRRALMKKRIAAAYNPIWGSIFREGRTSSRFGEQIKDVACIYTSRVSNLCLYPAQKFFVSTRERMPHE